MGVKLEKICDLFFLNAYQFEIFNTIKWSKYKSKYYQKKLYVVNKLNNKTDIDKKM